MIALGDISVSLVNAETKEAFPEHEKDGQWYVEVEPGAEYFIRVKKSGTSEGDVTRVEICVDGKDLGYWRTLRDGQEDYLGSWFREDGEDFRRALKFTRPNNHPGKKKKKNGHHHVGNKRNNLVTGTIRVKLLEYLPTTALGGDGSDFDPTVEQSSGEEEEYVRCRFNPQVAVPARTTTNEENKAVRTVAGEYAESVGRVPCCPDVWKTGRAIGTIKLKYCSPPGLVAAGVLDKPPQPINKKNPAAKDFQCQNKNHNRRNGQPLLHRAMVTPQKHLVKERTENGTTLYKEYELYDLCCISDVDNDSDVPANPPRRQTTNAKRPQKEETSEEEEEEEQSIKPRPRRKAAKYGDGKLLLKGVGTKRKGEKASIGRGESKRAAPAKKYAGKNKARASSSSPLLSLSTPPPTTVDILGW